MSNYIKLWGLTNKEISDKLITNNFDINNLFMIEKCLNCSIKIINESDKKNSYEKLCMILEKEFPNNIYAYNDNTLAKSLVELLNRNHFTTATSESLTGGMVASALVDVTGVSSCFYEGIVTYSNESKMKNLGVKEATLEKYGAVSSQVALQMVKGLKAKTNVNLTLSTTGIAGPTGDTPDKPLGLTYIGICANNYEYVKKCIFKGDRDIVRGSATTVALGLAVNYLKNIYKK